MFDKLSAIENKYDQMMVEMAEPAVQGDSAKFRSHSKAVAEMQPLVERFREYKDVVAQINATEELLKDPDMRELAQEELRQLVERRDALLADIKVLLVPKDPNDAKNVVLEIRAGHRRRRGGALCVGPVPHVFAVRRAARVEARGAQPERDRQRRHEGSDRASSKARTSTAA